MKLDRSAVRFAILFIKTPLIRGFRYKVLQCSGQRPQFKEVVMYWSEIQEQKLREQEFSLSSEEQAVETLYISFVRALEAKEWLKKFLGQR